MSTAKGLVARLRTLFRPRAVERDLHDEIALHLELQTAANIRAGMPPAEAHRQAMLAFGGVDRFKEQHRDGRGARWLGDTLADARYALRTLARNPALAGAAIVTLALGIGANTAIFSAVNAVILRPLPFAQPDQLVTIGEDNAEFSWQNADASPANYLDWREQVHAFRDIAAFPTFPGPATLVGYGEPRLLRALDVTGNFFTVLGVRADQGRVLTDAETWTTTGVPPAVISYRAWRDVFGADRALVGRTAQIDGRAVQIVGVLPEGFTLPGFDVDLFQPVAWDPANRSKIWFRRAHFVRTIARLKPGVTLDAANAELQTVVHRLQRDFPATNKRMGAQIVPLHDFLVGDTRRPLLVLLGAVAVLLLIACANVGNLLLVRAAGRERESALRLALGAGRGRLIRQAVTESLVLSALGGAAGLALGWWGTRVLAALQPARMLPVKEFAVGWEVLAYILTAAVASGLLFGIAPALWAGRRIPAEVLKDEGRSSTGGRRARRWGDALVIGEVALALTLTLGAGLLVRSYLGLQRVDAGFTSDGVLTASISLPGIRFDSVSKVLTFYQELARQARALPGVEAAAIVSTLPTAGAPWSSQFTVAGAPPSDRMQQVLHRELEGEYQQVMRVPLLRGRLLTDADGRGAPYVVLINEALARKYFGDRDPIGARVTFDRVPDSASTWRTIVGVVGSERQAGVAIEPAPEFIAPYPQEPRNSMTLVMRTRGDPAAFGPAVRQIVNRLDPTLAITRLRTMNDVRAESLARDRFLATLFLGFAGIGALLAVVGVYGMVAQMAKQRTREMGIRVALGAGSRQIQWLVVRHGLALAVIGAGLGVGVSLIATRAMTALLYQVAPADTLTFATVPALIVITALVASWLPAHRASRADPATVLRAD